MQRVNRLGLNILRAAILVVVGAIFSDLINGGPALLDGVLIAMGFICYVATFIDWGDRELF